MIKENDTYQKIGKLIGLVVGYFLFTTISYFILLLSNNLSKHDDYWLVMGWVMLMGLVGFGLKKILK